MHYRCYDPTTHRVYVSRHVIFHKTELFSQMGALFPQDIPSFALMLETPLVTLTRPLQPIV